MFFQHRSTAHELPPGFVALQIADGLDPVCMALAPDGRLFFTEKSGRVRIVENGTLQLDPFLEIPVDNFNERGLSGIAIDPDFPNSPFVYLYYTVPGAGHNRLSRFRAEGPFAVPGSEEILLDLDPLEGPNHNAGAMAFATDGTLFVATGDGRSINAPQELNSLFGKILRLNKDGTIPADNPFFSQTTGKYRAIWSLGHRNPFGLAYDAQTNRLFSTDVGSHRFEEVNEVFRGKNYGWPIVEGSFGAQTPPSDYQPPIIFYNHDEGCAAVGVTAYNPAILAFPSKYWGKLFYADYCNGTIALLDPDTGETEHFATDINRPLSLLTALDGTMYYLARAGIGDGSDEDNTTTNAGSLWRIIYTGNGAPFIAVQPKDKLVPVGENAQFDIEVFGVEPMHYQWQVNGANAGPANLPFFIFQNTTLADSGAVVRCIISNVEGSDTTDNALLHVTTNQRPLVEIVAPSGNLLYRGGDAINFSGTATDPEDGPLPASHFTWKIDFHHDQHTHPVLGPVTGIAEGSFEVPKNGEVSENVWFRINMTAVDSDGLSKSEQRLIFPKKSDIRVNTHPPGLLVDADGTLQPAPFTIRSVVGIYHDFNVPQTAVTSDSVYVFQKWTSGHAAPRMVFEAPEADFDLTAQYKAVQALGEGQGLTGSYFKDYLKNFTFQDPVIMRRLDPVIDFEWGEGVSPNEEYLGTDYFLVRWEGYIKPLVTDTFTFHLITNDGSRLWVDGDLLVDAWFGQGTNEYHSHGTFLEEGNYYPIKLEFFEALGSGNVQLLWSSSQVPRAVVPSSQLFPAIPMPPFTGKGLEATTYPNPATEKLTVEIGSDTSTSVLAEVFDATGRFVFMEKWEVPDGISKQELPLTGLSKGAYFLKLTAEKQEPVQIGFLKM